MLEAIIELGSYINNKEDVLCNYIKEINTTKNNEPMYIIKFNFSTKEVSLKIDSSEQIDKNTVYKYLYIGSVAGSNSPQWYATSTVPEYHLSETIKNLLQQLEEDSTELTQSLKWILDNYFVDYQNEFNSNKYRYILDVEKLGISTRTMQEMLTNTKNEKKPGKAMLGELKKELKKYYSDELHLKERQIGLYAILIDNKPLCMYDEYKVAVTASKKIPEAKKDKKNIGGLCSNCLSGENVTSALNKMSIKYYTTNQLIFASNLDKNGYHKNMQLCKDCYSNLLSSENFIQNRLKTRLSVFNCYVVPHFIYGGKLSASEINNISEKIVKTFNSAKNIKNMAEFRDDIINLMEIDDIEGYFLLNLIFFKRVNVGTKILRFIKDVPPSVFERIKNSFEMVEEIKEKIIPQIYHYRPGLENIYYLTPIRISEGDATNYRDLLAIYDALFTGRKLKKGHLINNLLAIYRIHFWNKQGYNVEPDSKNLCYKIFDGVMLLTFLEKMGCLESEGYVMELKGLGLKESLQNFIFEMKYNEQQTAMFLLGYLVGQVGNAQSKRNNNQEGTYKPILNKINFSGMDKEKLIRLSNEILVKLRQEKILVYNEVPFYEFKKLMDKNINAWKLSKQENLFYLLSGYAFGTTLPYQKKEENINE